MKRKFKGHLMRGKSTDATVVVPFHKGSAGLCGSGIIPAT